MKAAIKKSRQELIELGIKTTYAVAVRKDGQFCIIDANPVYGVFNRPKPPLLPLHGKIYPDYQSAFDAIVAEVDGAGERSEA